MARETYLEKQARLKAEGVRTYKPPTMDSMGNITDRDNKVLFGNNSPYHAGVNEAARAAGQHDLFADDRPPPPAPPGGSPSGGRRYGGGSYGTSAKAQALKTSQGLQALLASGRFGARDISGDTARINSGVSADQASRSKAFQALTDTINNQANPYSNVELTQARTLDPRLAAMLRSQGGDVGAYEAEIGLANTLAGQGADADQRFLRAIAAGRDAQKADSLQATGEASEYGRSEIAAAGTAAKAALAERGAS